MGEFGLISPGAAHRATDQSEDREALTGFTVLVAVAAAVVLAAFAVLLRDTGHALILTLLGMLSVVGIFFLFAAGVGLVSFSQETNAVGVLDAISDGAEEPLLIARPDGRAIHANAAFIRMLEGDATAASLVAGSSAKSLQAGSAAARTGTRSGRVVNGVGHIEALVTRDPAQNERFYRLVSAAERGSAWEETFNILPANIIQGAAGDAAAVEVATVVDPLGMNAAGVSQLRVSVSPVRLGEGEQELLAVWRLTDVSTIFAEHNQAERELENLVAHLDAMPVGIFAAGEDGRLAFVNQTLADWLGVERSRLFSGEHRVSDILSIDDASHFSPDRLKDQGIDAMRFDVDLVREDGKPMPVRLYYRAEFAARGSALGIVMRHAPDDMVGQSAESAELRFARFFHGAPIAIATVSQDGMVGSGNAAFRRLFLNGRPVRSREGDNLIHLLAGDAQDAVRVALATAIEGQTAIAPIETTVGDGGKRSVRLFVSGTMTEDGGDQHAIVYAIETTKQKELEVQFAQSQKMQAVGQLAGGIAHDFNNVLTVIIGFSDLLLANHRPTDPAFRDLMAIKQNANRAAGLVRQLLAFSRRQTLRPEVVGLTDVISDLSILLSRLIGEKVELKVNHGRDLWYTRADVTQLGQVIMNLAVNARDAMADGGQLTIRTRNMTERQSLKLKELGVEPGEYVVCEFTDTGCGMTPEIRAKVFEPFFSTKEVGKGTGLGLSTVYGIIKQTGGYIYCESEPGKGTTFTIYLPRFTPEENVDGPVVKVKVRERARDMTGSGTVLLVEDEEAVRRFAVAALQRQGYQVIEAGTGAEAVTLMADRPEGVDLVVSDIVMPEMDGPTMLKHLRASRPDLKIIFISGYAEDALDSLEGHEEFAFLPKPFQLKELVAKVKETMDG